MKQAHDFKSECAREHARPIEDILGKQTLRVVCSLQSATAAILKRPAESGLLVLSDFKILTAWRTLTEPQLSELRSILTDPDSYWNGWPIYRRFPPRPGFAVRLSGAEDKAVLLIDLHNPGWELLCGAERYWGFNFAGPRLSALAKSIFPEHASAHSTSVWKKGAIKVLEGG